MRDISRIIAAHTLGQELSQDDRAALDQWLSASEANRQLLQRIMEGHATATVLRLAEEGYGERMFSRIKVDMARRKRRRIALYGAVASSVAALVAGIFLLAGQGDRRGSGDLYTRADANPVVLHVAGEPAVELAQGQQGTWREALSDAGIDLTAATGPVMIRVEVPRGREYGLTLDDGTVVKLNAGSLLEYPDRFGEGQRRVTLTGEGYFEVAHDRHKPFTLNTGDGLEVTVLGTKFNVNSYPDASGSVVTLAEGSVSVANEAGQVVLEADQQAVFDRAANRIDVRPADAGNAIGWINGVFYFDSVGLDVILDAIAKWYDITIDTGNTDIGALGRFTLKADRGDSFAGLLDVLHDITGLNYTVSGRVVTLSF